MALEKELEETMLERSEWQGNPDQLWANVAQAISVPAKALTPVPTLTAVPTPTPTRRQAWRVPAWAAAAAVVMLAAGTWALRPGSMPFPPTTPPSVEQPGTPSTPPTVEQPGPLTPKGALPGPNPPDHRGPAPFAARFEITPGQEAFTPGEPVHLTVRFWNESKESIQLAATVPQLRINPASAIEDLRQPAMDSVALPELAGRKLAPGEVISVDTIWTGSQVAPGWYRAGLSHIQYQIGRTPAGIGGGGTRFFITYPPGSIKTGTVESGATATLHDITLTVRKLEFTDRETKVYFHLSKLRAPAEFGMTLERSGAPAGALAGITYKDSPEGGIDGVAQSDPTLAGASSFTVVVADLFGVRDGQGPEKLAGPWRVTVPLN